MNTLSTEILGALTQKAISLVCWALSFGLLQLLISSVFLTIILWLVYGSSLYRSSTWALSNAFFSLTPFMALGFILIYFNVKWLPNKLNGIITYSPMLPAMIYALLLVLLGMAFHITIATGPKQNNKVMLLALAAAYFFGAILRARIIGTL